MERKSYVTPNVTVVEMETILPLADSKTGTLQGNGSGVGAATVELGVAGSVEAEDDSFTAARVSSNNYFSTWDEEDEL